MSKRTILSLFGAVALSVAVLAGCGGDSEGDASSSTPEATASATGSPTAQATATATSSPTTQPSTTTTTVLESAVDVSAVELSELPEAAVELPRGYAEAEFVMSGVANLYTGPATGPATVAEEDVPYSTRVTVRAPEDPLEFSGRVLLEPFNTSGGGDFAAGWGLLGDALVENGDAWIGVTERVSSVVGLRDSDPERYGDLELVSNGQAWDIMSQLGGLLKEQNAESPLADHDVERVYMTGFSQSGVEIATYANAIHPLADMSDGSPIYDGYLVMGRAASMTTLDSGDSPLPAFEIAAMGPVDVAVIELLTESDVVGFSDPAYQNPGGALVRPADSDSEGDLYRLYEITGSAHAQMIEGCDGGGTTFPTVYFVRAAYRNLTAWAEDGISPPSTEPIEIAEAGEVVAEPARDEYANALGGVRSPYVDVPLSSYAPTDTPGPLCRLAGVETPLPSETLDVLYEDVDDYLEQFGASLDEAVTAGFLLERDVDQILADARAAADELL